MNQQMRDFFKFALPGEIENIVAAIVQIVATFADGAQRGIARRYAGQRDGFLGLITWVLFCRIVVSLMLSSSLLSYVGY